MDIKEYTSFFHDGNLIEISHDTINKKIILTMSSSEIVNQQILTKVKVSKENQIIGKLYIEGIEKIIVNDENYEKKLIKFTKDGEILDFEISNNARIILGILWSNKSEQSLFTEVIIEAKRYWWENLPN